MHPDEGLGNAAPAPPRLDQPHEEVRILRDREARIEAAELSQIRGAKGDAAAAGEADDEAPRSGRAGPALYSLPPVREREDDAGPAQIGLRRPAMRRQARGKEAGQQLVVVVEKGGDRRAGRRKAAVARGRRPLRGGVAEDGEARIRDRGEILGRAVARSVVHDDDLEGGAFLRQGAGERPGQQIRAVTGGDDHRYLGLIHAVQPCRPAAIRGG